MISHSRDRHPLLHVLQPPTHPRRLQRRQSRHLPEHRRQHPQQRRLHRRPSRRQPNLLRHRICSCGASWSHRIELDEWCVGVVDECVEQCDEESRVQGDWKREHDGAGALPGFHALRRPYCASSAGSHSIIDGHEIKETNSGRRRFLWHKFDFLAVCNTLDLSDLHHHPESCSRREKLRAVRES